MPYPKVTFCGIEGFKRNTDSWILGVIKSLDAFCCMKNERAFCRWEFHDNRLETNQMRRKGRSKRGESITFLETFRPTSLSLSEANGIGDNTEHYQKIKLILQ